MSPDSLAALGHLRDRLKLSCITFGDIKIRFAFMVQAGFQSGDPGGFRYFLDPRRGDIRASLEWIEIWNWIGMGEPLDAREHNFRERVIEGIRWQSRIFQAVFSSAQHGHPGVEGFLGLLADLNFWSLNHSANFEACRSSRLPFSGLACLKILENVPRYSFDFHSRIKQRGMFAGPPIAPASVDEFWRTADLAVPIPHYHFIMSPTEDARIASIEVIDTIIASAEQAPQVLTTLDNLTPCAKWCLEKIEAEPGIRHAALIGQGKAENRYEKSAINKGIGDLKKMGLITQPGHSRGYLPIENK